MLKNTTLLRIYLPLNISLDASENNNKNKSEKMFKLVANVLHGFTTGSNNYNAFKTNVTTFRTATTEVLVLVVFHLWLIGFFLAVLR